MLQPGHCGFDPCLLPDLAGLTWDQWWHLAGPHCSIRLLSCENTFSSIRKLSCLLCMMVLSKRDVPLSPSSPISPLDSGLTSFHKATLNLSLNISFCPFKMVRCEHADIRPAPKPLPHVQTPRTMLRHAPAMLHIACPPKPGE